MSLFERERPRLLALAYRLTGSITDAEDAVQESWLRFERTEDVRDPAAWLTTVVSRICLDRLTSAAARREHYVGTWLPEPVVRERDATAADPLDVVVRDDELRYAALVVLETLAPAQRVALVLHDAFEVPFAQVAEVLGVSPAHARQLAVRARKAVTPAPPPVSPGEHAEAVERLMHAVLEGDLEAVVAALHPDIVAYGDSNGRTPTAGRPIRGAAHVARFLLGLVRLYGPERLAHLRLEQVNGRLGLVTPGTDGRFPARVTAFTVTEGRVVATYDIANPDKLGGVRLEQWSPTAPDTPPRRRTPGR
ncbi:sigma-70 family RNA polymerase sigma factor [Aeromicrobium phragmitis]|uniref:Sigma-70 family RNA polymerase sigma factor n=1 Tax=Aeromicrobium phragmitis TaxID=2478914 RepID=A0A3L8PK53_9ACTN|nr:sigma-70 family RNA polymerase sigma factor [Aeromicrobium phragmitis]RLV55093.1 sigma-70 family RNA polymerase sigma factor [Aeromicrobium phragmitis]